MDFEQCYEQYKPLVQKVLHRCRVYKNFDEFRHIAMVALWEAMQSYDEKKGSFETYAYFMMRYQVIAEMRKQNVEQQRVMLISDDVLQFNMDNQQNTCVIETSKLAVVWEELAAEERYILHSYYVEQNSDKEIAESLQLKTDTLKKRRQRLLQRLKKQLSKC
ncbi:RNA polymerase sigma factor [Bacillus ndiopicus]|uniref:RNA polymerase sigma factor n=1 Tax=Bacillus ndiopicus TaxID=1347368 RepID=UPI000A7E4BF7|nr:sigma-70 family RNA polymerase sigma factor [Bacillus ndiopicus]